MKNKLGENIFQTINYTVFFIFAIICAYPFYYIFIYSISDPAEAMKGIAFLPVNVTLDNYIRVLSLPNVFNAFIVSVLRVIIGTALGVFITSLFSYILIQKELPFRKTIYRMSVASMYFNAGLIPYCFCRDILSVNSRIKMSNNCRLDCQKSKI